MIRQTFDPEEVNEVINHPAVRPWIGPPLDEPFDCSFLMNNDNVFLMTEGGGFAFLLQPDGTHSAHSHFLPEFRGKHAIDAGKEALIWLAERDIKIIGHTPKDNRAALLFNRLIGMRHVGSTEDMEIFAWG
jgi:hypothetical protein